MSAPVYIPFTLTDGSVPCVMVDTEPKVIRRCLDTKHNSTVLAQGVPRESCVWDKAGRGNNWAYGYYGSRTSGCGVGVLERVQEAVRKVVERCDRFSGFVMFHSIAGGTGSGDLIAVFKFFLRNKPYWKWGQVHSKRLTFTLTVDLELPPCRTLFLQIYTISEVSLYNGTSDQPVCPL